MARLKLRDRRTKEFGMRGGGSAPSLEREAPPREDTAPTWEAYGPVVTNPNDPLYLGASLKTVNTGELTALTWALEEIARRPRVMGGIHSVLSDSTYALGRALSSDKPKGEQEVSCADQGSPQKGADKTRLQGSPTRPH